MAKNYYDILGVTKTASETDIKQAYRKLSRELHPDKHKGDKGKEAQFKEVNEAYEVLSDPKKKQAYDQFGSADGNPFGQGFNPGAGGFSGFSADFDPSQFGNFSDIFESFFGGNAASRTQRQTKGRDIEVEISVPFTESVSGGQREVTFKTEIICDVCSGGGSEPGSSVITCPECSGTGQVMRQSRSLFGMIQQAIVCPRCKGGGKIPEKACHKCKGEGRVSERKTVTVTIPAGIADGQTLRLRGEGEAGRQGSPAGDLFVHVRVQADPRFTREGDDIHSELKINLIDAVLGTDVPLETVQGTVSLAIPAGIQPDQVLRVKGKGMPVLNTHRFGDHYVTIKVEIPKKLNREQKRLFEELRKN